jgi:hypothetical protein
VAIILEIGKCPFLVICRSQKKLCFNFEAIGSRSDSLVEEESFSLGFGNLGAGKE